jgi:competence protein ComEA
MPKILIAAFCCLVAAVSVPNPSRAASRPIDSAPALSPATARSAPTNPKSLSQPASSAAGVVNLNDANADQLVLLPGVGPSKAAAIIAYRKSHPFKRLEDLTRVKGFGRKTFSRLRPLLSVNGPTTLKERPVTPLRPPTTSSSAS